MSPNTSTSNSSEPARESRTGSLSDLLHKMKESTIVGEVAEEEVKRLILENTNPVLKLDKASQTTNKYLLSRAPEFRRLTRLRNNGWLQEAGDEYFDKKHKRSDQGGPAYEVRSCYMMVLIAEELEQLTKALTSTVPAGEVLSVLDICAAPGGYSAATLEHNPGAKVHLITLPRKLGGHELMVSGPFLEDVKYADITLYASEFTNLSIPATHPDANSFSADRPWVNVEFDLIFCDGVVLRSHSRHRLDWREYEVTRLVCSQLILALQRVSHGGTIIMLLHNADQWHTMSLLYRFSKFSHLILFKPTRGHRIQSSFYMIARKIQPRSSEAMEALSSWRDMWYQTTFGGDGGTGEAVQEPNDEDVQKVIDEFGPALMGLCTAAGIWRIQADALSKEPWTRDRTKETTDHQQGHVHPRDLKTWRV